MNDTPIPTKLETILQVLNDNKANLAWTETKQCEKDFQAELQKFKSEELRGESEESLILQMPNRTRAELMEFCEKGLYEKFESDKDKIAKFDYYKEHKDMLKNPCPKRSKIGLRLSGDFNEAPLEVNIIEAHDGGIIIKNESGQLEAIDLSHIFSIVRIPVSNTE